MDAAKPRWLGMDLLRLLCFFFIMAYHLGLFYFEAPNTGFTHSSSLIRLVDSAARYFVVSGFVIALMSSFLLARTNLGRGKQLRILGVLAFGWAYLAFDIDGTLVVPWDVFSTLLVSFAVLFVVQRWGIVGIRALGFVGYILLWIPFWELGAHLPSGLHDVKIAMGLMSCAQTYAVEWPLLPWVGIVWLGYWLGCEAMRFLEEGKAQNLRLSLPEGLLWMLALGASFARLGDYRAIRVGSRFACEAYQQDPTVFWSHFVWGLWIMRLAVDPRIQGWLGRSKAIVAISGWAISRKFWVAYIVQFALIGGEVALMGLWQANDPVSFARFELPALELILLTMLIQIEVVTRLILEALARLRRPRPVA